MVGTGQRRGRFGGAQQSPRSIPRLRYSWRLDLAGVHVGLTHDVPWPELPPNLTVERWKQRRFGTQDIDVLVFGDSHVEGIHQVGPTLCVNPGSPTYPHNLNTQLGTLGFLHIADDRRHRNRARPQLWQLTEHGADGPFTTGDDRTSPPAPQRSHMAADLTYDNVLVDVDGAVATITLNRPEQLNALSRGLLADLYQALRDLNPRRRRALSSASAATAGRSAPATTSARSPARTAATARAEEGRPGDGRLRRVGDRPSTASRCAR